MGYNLHVKPEIRYYMPCRQRILEQIGEQIKMGYHHGYVKKDETKIGIFMSMFIGHLKLWMLQSPYHRHREFEFLITDILGIKPSRKEGSSRIVNIKTKKGSLISNIIIDAWIDCQFLIKVNEQSIFSLNLGQQYGIF